VLPASGVPRGQVGFQVNLDPDHSAPAKTFGGNTALGNGYAGV
jgi:hypothetical protein